MKRLIGVVLVSVLLTVGLGDIAYAEIPSNNVIADIRADWVYEVFNGDNFENGEVTGRVEWHTHVSNHGDESGADVISPDVSLYSEQEFTHMQDELIDQMGPPNYEWHSFSNIPEGSNVVVYIGFSSPEEMPVTFIPGFDASRVFTDDKTRFFQSDGAQLQEMTVTLTPRDTTDVGVLILTPPCEAGMADAEIQPPDISDYFELSTDGQKLSIYPEGLEVDQAWEATIEIAVTPNVPAVNFKPYVLFGPLPAPEPIPGYPITGSSIQLDMIHMGDTLGTFTWTVDGDYTWYEKDRGVEKKVSWGPRCVAIPLIQVDIDIKPSSYPNSINPNSKGVIAVAVLTTADFDAAAVDPDTVVFGPEQAVPVQYAMEDVDHDGDFDLVLHFKTQDTGIQEGAVEATLKGETWDDAGIIGTDTIRVIEKGKK